MRDSSPKWFMPISATMTSVSLVMRMSVSGRPISLFRLPSVFCARNCCAEHGVKQLLGGGLADRAGHADDRAAAHRAVAAREVEQRLRGVLDVQRRDRIFLAFSRWLMTAAAPFSIALPMKSCRVEAFALERQEQRLRRNAAASRS